MRGAGCYTIFFTSDKWDFPYRFRLNPVPSLACFDLDQRTMSGGTRPLSASSEDAQTRGVRREAGVFTAVDGSWQFTGRLRGRHLVEPHRDLADAMARLMANAACVIGRRDPAAWDPPVGLRLLTNQGRYDDRKSGDAD